MLGYEVTKEVLDVKSAVAVLALRSAFDKVEAIAEWLSNHPNSPTEPLVTEFGYNADEAYALRYFFETFNAIRINNDAVFDVGRKMTGLE